MRLNEWGALQVGHHEYSRQAAALAYDHNADVRAANAELERLEDALVRMAKTTNELLHERDEARAEVERLRACLVKANASTEDFERKWYLEKDKSEELEAQLAETRKTPPLPESVAALLWSGSEHAYRGCAEDCNDKTRAAYALGLAKGKDAEAKMRLEARELFEDVCRLQGAADKLEKVREVVYSLKHVQSSPTLALEQIAAIVEPPHVHEWTTWRDLVATDGQGLARQCPCGARQLAEWKDAPK